MTHAEDHLTRAKTILESVSVTNPRDPDVLCDLGETLTKLGELFQRMRQLERSEAHARRATAILDRLVDRHPTRPRYRLAAGIGDDRTLGQTLIGIRRFQDAVPFATRGESVFEGLRADYPDAWSLPWEVADQLVTLTVALSSIGRGAEAGEAVGRLGRLGDPLIRSQNLAEIAWHLTQSKAPSLRAAWPSGAQPRRRRTRARFQSSRGTSWVLSTPAKGVGTCDRDADAHSNHLKHNPAYPISGFLLAMAFHHKGDAARARFWFDLAAARMANPEEGL